MSVISQIDKLLENATKENNETEKTISLQLIGVAIFVTTVIGAFVALPGNQGLSLAGRIFLLIDLIFLFLSLTFGIFHLLVVKGMWLRSMRGLALAREVLEEVDPSIPDKDKVVKIANLIHRPLRTTMVFFYLQLAMLGIGVTIFLGLIITLLF